MPTECIPDLFGFASVEHRAVVAAFDGGAITSDAGALLLGAADRAIGLHQFQGTQYLIKLRCEPIRRRGGRERRLRYELRSGLDGDCVAYRVRIRAETSIARKSNGRFTRSE